MLTGFQLRAARACLSLHLEDISTKIGINKSTLTRLESITPNLVYINSTTRTSILIKNFYDNHGIIFPHYNSIRMIVNSNNQSNNEFNRFHFKISRVALRLSRKKLGHILNIPESTLTAWEHDGSFFDAVKPNNYDIKPIILYFKNLGITHPQFNTIELLEDPVEKINI